MIYEFLIGIDIGVETGFSVYDTHKKTLVSCQTTTIHQAQEWVQNYSFQYSSIKVRLEDVNTYIPYKGVTKQAQASRAQGAGSIKRDLSIWKGWLEHHNIPYDLVGLRDCPKKVNPEYFKQLTGWEKRTSVHARDAAMLVFGF